MTRKWIALFGLLPILLTGCGEGAGRDAAEPAPSGALPELGSHPIGPQPGPDRPLAETENPFGQEPNVLAEGRRLFVWFNCAGCHGGHGGGGMGPSLRDATWLYGGKDQDVFSSIAQGRARGMPAWGTKLPAQTIWKITAYIKSMNTPLEPEKPPKNPVYPSPPPRRDTSQKQARKDDGP